MTSPRGLPSPQGESAKNRYGRRQLFRRPAPTVVTGGPPVFRAAVGPPVRGGVPFDPEVHRVHYVAEDEGNNVYWDQWDTSFDTTIFNIGPYLQTNDATEGQVIAGVELLKRGLYSINAMIDVDDAFNGTSLLKSNYDEGQGEFRYHNNLSPPSAHYWGDLYGIRLDHWRFLDVANPDTTPPISFHDDTTWGGASPSDVEIVLAVNTDIDFGSDATAAKSGGSAGDDVWIPGGDEGGWGFTPRLLVAYWGDPTSGDDPAWPGTFM